MVTINNVKKILIREAAVLAAVLVVGYLFSADGPTNFRYPMSARPEVKLGLQAFGHLITYWGYPILLLLRFLNSKRNQQRPRRTQPPSGSFHAP